MLQDNSGTRALRFNYLFVTSRRLATRGAERSRQWFAFATGTDEEDVFALLDYDGKANICRVNTYSSLSLYSPVGFLNVDLW
jgi:hypothetical protein